MQTQHNPLPRRLSSLLFSDCSLFLQSYDFEELAQDSFRGSVASFKCRQVCRRAVPRQN